MQEKMSSPLQRMYFTAQRALRENLIPLLSALLFGLAAHMFVFSNKLMNADEVMISSAGTLCSAADEVDGKKVGGRAPELLRTIQDEVLREFLEETKEC